MGTPTYFLGLDLGTSSIKGLLRGTDGTCITAKAGYASATPQGWYDAMREVTAELSRGGEREIAAVGFSSQVGTYVINETEVISWQSDVGREELNLIKERIPEERFIREISMPHPELISYPLPRLLYIQKQFGEGCRVHTPKELLLRELTGDAVNDPFSMRGIANLQTGEYAFSLMRELGIAIRLPPLRAPTDLAGRVCRVASERYLLKEGTPVYVGCNDFFAGLIGMGIYEVGSSFELSGTSEHVGYISEGINPRGFVSGRYFNGFCTYGGTKASGACCDLAIKSFGSKMPSLEIVAKKPPIFLPYLKGERAPIFDENAHGVYFGIHADTDSPSLAYATLEGVVFGIYDIAASMDMPRPSRLILGGGSAMDRLMNELRATLLDCDVVTVKVHDTSALGAALIAMTGYGAFESLAEAIAASVEYSAPIRPRQEYRELLIKRFSVYKQLYSDLKERFKDFKNL